jgi:four helix bundle protein
MSLRHHTLVAWQRADDLFITVHALTHKVFPPYERFELGSQARRAAFSVAVNIVEGCAREHRKERLQLLNVSRASLAELGYCIHAARRLGYLNEAAFAETDLAVRQVAAPLSGFIAAVRNGTAR